MTSTARCILMRRKLVTNHTNDLRDSCRTPIQNDDGTLHAEQEAEYRNGQPQKRTVPTSEFMRDN